MLTRIKRGIGFLLILLTTSFASGAYAQDVTLRMQHFLPAQSTVPAQILDVWADNVERDSDGRIKVERFPSMQLGGTPPDLIDQAIYGVADIVWTVVGYTPGRFPTTEVFELPFFVTDSRAASSAYWQMFERHMKDGEFADVHVLATWVHGPGLLHTRRPVSLPDDLKGMKIRGGSRLVNDLLERAGATPVGMPLPTVPEALSKGVIDGTTVPWEVTPAVKIPELVTNHTEFEGAWLYTLTFVMAMNKDRYEGLPDDLRAVIDRNSGLEFSIFAGGVQQAADAPARQIALDRGNTIVNVKGDSIDLWRDQVAPIRKSWIADMAQRGLDGQALIDEAQRLMSDFEG